MGRIEVVSGVYCVRLRGMWGEDLCKTVVSAQE